MNKVINVRNLNANHHFIYGNKTEKRTDILKELDQSSPLESNREKPCVIYVPDIGLPPIEIQDEMSKYLIETSANEYINYSVIQALIAKILASQYYDEIEYRSKELFSLINNEEIRIGGYNINDYKELENALSCLKVNLRNYYEEYSKRGKNGCGTTTVTLNLMAYLKNFKIASNNNATPVILLDNREVINNYSYQAINSLIKNTPPSIATINVVTSFDDWQTYYTFAGEMLHCGEHYDIIELDDNLKNAQDALIKKYSFDE